MRRKKQRSRTKHKCLPKTLSLRSPSPWVGQQQPPRQKYSQPSAHDTHTRWGGYIHEGVTTTSLPSSQSPSDATGRNKKIVQKNKHTSDETHAPSIGGGEGRKITPCSFLTLYSTHTQRWQADIMELSLLQERHSSRKTTRTPKNTPPKKTNQTNASRPDLVCPPLCDKHQTRGVGIRDGGEEKGGKIKHTFADEFWIAEGERALEEGGRGKGLPRIQKTTNTGHAPPFFSPPPKKKKNVEVVEAKTPQQTSLRGE